jgi:hypothetical protein
MAFYENRLVPLNHQTAMTAPSSLHWLTSPEAGLVIGVLGLISAFFGLFLSYRAEKKVAQNLSEERERIIKGVADVVGALQPPHPPAPRGESAPESSASARSAKPPRPTRSWPRDGPMDDSLAGVDLQAQPGEYMGSIDVTGDGDPDLLVEQILQERASLKVFSWQEFDLVLIAELQNETGAHFHLRGSSSIATLDWAEGKLVERVFTWSKGQFREDLNTELAEVEVFRKRPDWSI